MSCLGPVCGLVGVSCSKLLPCCYPPLTGALLWACFSLQRVTLPPPLSLNTPVIIPISINTAWPLLFFFFPSRGYTVALQPCVTHPSLHGQLHKNKGAYPRESVREGQSKSTRVCLFVFITFSFHCILICLSFRPPPLACSFRRRGHLSLRMQFI